MSRYHKNHFFYPRRTSTTVGTLAMELVDAMRPYHIFDEATLLLNAAQFFYWDDHERATLSELRFYMNTFLKEGKNAKIVPALLEVIPDSEVALFVGWFISKGYHLMPKMDVHKAIYAARNASL